MMDIWVLLVYCQTATVVAGESISDGEGTEGCGLFAMRSNTGAQRAAGGQVSPEKSLTRLVRGIWDRKCANLALFRAKAGKRGRHRIFVREEFRIEFFEGRGWLFGAVCGPIDLPVLAGLEYI